MFDEAFYLSRYPDVAAAVRAGSFKSGQEHYILHGKAEGREAAPSPVTRFMLGTNPIVDTSTVFAVRSDHTDNAVANQAYHQATFTFTSTGQGATRNGNESQSWWGGVTSIFKKGGSGSAHGFTCSVWLERTLGYAEAGGYQGQVENRSAHGNFLSMFEGIVKDNGYRTNMSGLVVRMVKDATTAVMPTQAIMITGEGKGVIDAILTSPLPNAQFNNRFFCGVDLSRCEFTSGFAHVLPNGASIGWLNTGGVTVPVVQLGSDNSLYLRIEGQLKRVSIGSPDSGGVGMRLLMVDN